MGIIKRLRHDGHTGPTSSPTRDTEAARGGTARPQNSKIRIRHGAEVVRCHLARPHQRSRHGLELHHAWQDLTRPDRRLRRITMLWSVLQGVALVLVGLLAWAFNVAKRLKYRHIPGPKPAPVLGNLPQVTPPPPPSPPGPPSALRSNHKMAPAQTAFRSAVSGPSHCRSRRSAACTRPCCHGRGSTARCSRCSSDHMPLWSSVVSERPRAGRPTCPTQQCRS